MFACGLVHCSIFFLIRMGNTSPRSSRNSQQRALKNSHNDDQALRQIARKIEEKENICIAMQKDIDLAILQGNTKDIESLKNDINANLIDLNQVFKIQNIPDGMVNLTKAGMVKHTFETNLAKLKSLEPQQEKNSTENSSNGNPDLVKDLIRVDEEPSRLLNEKKLKSVADELTVLKDWFARSGSDYDVYCVLDKGGFYLQTDLRNIEIPTTSPLHQRKHDLIDEVSAFRDSVSRRFADIQEQQNFIKALDTLLLELREAANEHDFEVIHKKALALHEQMPTSPWGNGLSSSKETVLKKLTEIEQSTLVLKEKCHRKKNSQKQIEPDGEPDLQIEDLPHDSSADQVENLYSNLDVVKQHKFDTNADDGLQNIQTATHPQNQLDFDLTRYTIYANEDVIHNMDYSSLGHEKYKVEIKKPPLPSPRNSEDAIINKLPRYWQKLNEILLADSSDETSRNEVVYIQKEMETAKNLFEEKMKLVLNKFEATVQL